MVLGEEKWEDLFGNSTEITSLNGFSCDEDDIDNITERRTQTKTLNTALTECYFFE